MILVTVGTQLPFERLVGAVDAWAARQSTPPDVLAQVGTGRTDYAYLRCVETLDGDSYAQAIGDAQLMVAHCGTGSILTALDCGVSVIVFPRDDAYGEHRDDHQKQTARQMERMGLVKVAWSVTELQAMIDMQLATPPSARQPRRRNMELVDYLRGWIAEALDGSRR